MSAGYYIGTYPHTIVLQHIYPQPTVGVTGVVNFSSPASYVPGILGTAGTTYTLTNKGTIQSVGNLGLGVNLSPGGIVTNNAGGVIQGTGQGIEIQGAGGGTVSNSGNIAQIGSAGFNGIFLPLGGTVTNSGVIRALASSARRPAAARRQ